jgi:cell wall-associated NlpC family hydrolase
MTGAATLDPRRVPARPDLAAAHLRGHVEAERYAEATVLAVTVPLAPLTRHPDGTAPLETQLLHGETFAAYEQTDGWAWGQSQIDGYVGYVPAECLMAGGAAPNHRVAQPLSHVYPQPALKTRPIGALTYGARLEVVGFETGFAALDTGGFVPVQHLAPLDAPAADWVAEAERMLGAPYLWGGRSPGGLDCSALVQLARQAAGHGCPRDTDMQCAELGRSLPAGTPPQRGDLIFWRGHVAIMLDGARMLHANAHHMAVTVEPLAEARPRIEEAGDGPVTRHARLDGGAEPR